MLAGYDFNTKYITEYNNFPLWTRLLQGKVNQQFLVELILDGRINLETPEIDKIKEPEIVKSIKSRRYVEKIPVLKLCKAKNLDAEELNARLNVISEVVYQLQLSDYIGKDGEVNINDSDFGKICDCISNILKAQKEGIFPYHLLSNRNEECHNKDTLAINSLEQISPKQLVTVIDQKQWVNEDGKKVHPKYCFDRGDIKGLLSTGINPYTNIVISEVFLNRIYNGYQVLPRAMELREAIEEIIEFDNLLPPKYPSDFDQVFERFRATLSKVNPYLDYQKWATEYTVEQYNIPIPELGSGQPMVHLWHTTGYNPEGVSFVDKFQIKIPLTLPREKYVTILMAMCNNKMEDKHNQVLYVVNAVRAMLDNLEPYKVIEKPSVGLEELKERKAELLKEFLTGGMKDRALMGEIQKIRGQIAELED